MPHPAVKEGKPNPTQKLSISMSVSDFLLPVTPPPLSSRRKSIEEKNTASGLLLHVEIELNSAFLLLCIGKIIAKAQHSLHLLGLFRNNISNKYHLTCVYFP